MRVEGARHAGAAVDVVDDEEEALRAEGRELAHDDGLGGRIERGEGLVEEQDLSVETPVFFVYRYTAISSTSVPVRNFPVPLIFLLFFHMSISKKMI